MLESPNNRNPAAHFTDRVAFAAYLSSTAGNPPLNYLSSQDSGVTWQAPLRVDGDPAYRHREPFAWLTADENGRVIAAWTAEQTIGGSLSVVSKVSPDFGQSWPPAVTAIAALSGFPVYPAVAFLWRPAGEIWMTWLDGASDADIRLRHSVSHDDGKSWQPPALLRATAGVRVKSYALRQLPSGALALLYVAEALAGEDRAYFTRSDDGGVSWSSRVELTGRVGRAYLPGIDLLVGRADVLLASWTTDQDGAWDAYSLVSLDGGLTWAVAPVRVDAGDPPGSSYASGGLSIDRVDDAGGIVAVWVDNRDGPRRVYSNHSRDFGQTWGSPAGAPASPLSVNASDAYPNLLRLVAHPETGWVTVFWHDELHDAMARCGRPSRCHASYFSRSCDGGASWETPERFLDENDLIGQEYPSAMSDGAVSLVLQTDASQVRAMRIDGASRTAALGPTVYCVGNDPPLETRMVSAHCPAGFAWQWYEDGVAVPGATATVYRPSLAAGKHTVEARGTCLSDPTCAPAAIPVELEAVAPGIPPDVGNTLRAVRDGSTAAVLSWHDLVTAASRHFHLRRAFAKGVVGTRIAPDPGLVSRSYRDEPPAAERLVLYDLRQATPCEDESRN